MSDRLEHLSKRSLSLNIKIMDQTMLNLIRKFIKEANEFTEHPSLLLSHSMTESLEMISTLDFGSFCPDKIEAAVFFSSLWDAMSHSNGPRWAAISVLKSAVNDSATQNMLLHNYRFIPILSTLLLENNQTPDNQIELLILMENLSHGIKVSWEEPYLSEMIKYFCNWILKGDIDPAFKEFPILSLSILVNLCYKNEIVINLLIKTMNMSNLIKCLLSKKNCEIGSVQVCRFLIIIQNHKSSIQVHDVHNYLGVALRSLATSIKEINENDLRGINLLINDLCTDPFTRPHLLTYDHYEKTLHDALKLSPGLLSISNSNKKCLQYIFSILLNILRLELYSIRNCHKMIAELCVNACSIPDLLGPALRLLGMVILQYEEDGMLPDDLMPTVSIGFHTLLDSSKIDPILAGLDWMRFVSSLCDCHATREAVFANINADKFEEVFKQTMNYHTQNFTMRSNYDQEIILITCHICLSLANRNKNWEALLHRVLSSTPVIKVFSMCISNIQSLQRKHFFRVIRHPEFPIDRLNQIIMEGNFNPLEISNNSAATVTAYGCTKPNEGFSSSQENAFTELINKISNAFENKENANNVSIPNLMELYKYKIANLEHRLNCSSHNLKSAEHTISSLNHSITMLNATNKNQDEILYQTQLYNKRLEDNYNRHSNQIADAEKTIKKFQDKLAAERLDREKQFAILSSKYTSQIKDMEDNIESKDKENVLLQNQLKILEATNNNLVEKLNEQATKNGELAGVLEKFEEKVKNKDRKLEEQNNLQMNLKNELEQSQQNVKSLEKTLLEREKRLAQVTTQLEEMHRIQEIIANLMGNKTAANNSTS